MITMLFDDEIVLYAVLHADEQWYYADDTLMLSERHIIATENCHVEILLELLAKWTVFRVMFQYLAQKRHTSHTF